MAESPTVGRSAKSTEASSDEAHVSRSRSHSTSKRNQLDPFPNCWFHLAPFDAFEDGEVLSFKFLGHDIIAFKTGEESVSVMDAYCPHLGAHLGRDPKGKNNRLREGCVRCPYHHLSFDAEGECVGAPKGTTVPRTRVNTWETEIVEGLVFVYHHKEKKPSDWKISDFFQPQGNWSRAYMSYEGVHPIHPQEAAENSVDTLHFRTLHRFNQVVQASEAVADRQHFYQTLHIGQPRDIPKPFRKVPIYSIVKEAAVGVGFPMAHNYFHPIGLQVNHLVFLTPMDETSTMFRFYFQVCFDEVKLPRFLKTQKGRIDRHLNKSIVRAFDRATKRIAHALLGSMFVTVNGQDLDIWSHKSFSEKPALIKEDGNIRLFRKWAKQFY